VTSSKPAKRYQDIRRNVTKIKEYLMRGAGLDRVLTEQDMAYDAVRMCFLEISEAAIKLGALAELHDPEIPWNAVRGFGNHLRHTYDEMDLNAIERAVADLDRLDAACARVVDSKGLRAEWPDDLDLGDAPELVRDLAHRGLWLEQEPLVIDSRIASALEALL
jgi:uncharacterized protein with HEPN domain